MDSEIYKKLKDNAFKAKNKEEWDVALQAIAEAVKDDEPARESLRKYILMIKGKKETYFKQCAEKPKFQAKPKMMVSEETDAAIRELALTLTAYLRQKMTT